MESEDQIQVQVQIGETRRVFFMPSPKTYNNLIDAIMQEIPNTRSLTFGLLYENDDKELVVMNDDPLCIRIAISGLKCIPGTDIHRLKVRIFEGSSPSVKTKADQEITYSYRSSCCNFECRWPPLRLGIICGISSQNLSQICFTVFGDTPNYLEYCTYVRGMYPECDRLLLLGFSRS